MTTASACPIRSILWRATCIVWFARPVLGDCEIPMDATPRERQCYTKDCDALAEYACVRCGKPLCPQHAHLVRLERRLDIREHPHDLKPLARLPSRISTYALCVRCR